jgi:LysM repeat protein
MTSEPATLEDPYRVKQGDTLSAIAQRCGCTVAQLQRLNGLQNPRHLQAGQTLYLSERSAFGVTALFLDALRHPIANLPYQLRFDGRAVSGTTGPDGLVPRQVTRSAQSLVEVWVRQVDGMWQQIGATVSGYGHKLMTLVSGAVVVPGHTEAHPADAPAQLAEAPRAATSGSPQAALPPPANGTPTKNNPAIRTRRVRGPHGQPVLVLGVDIPRGLLEHFAMFKGGEIGDDDWNGFAKRLECEPSVLRAIADVESGRSSFWRLNSAKGAHIPAVVFERHYFSDLTNGRYDAQHPDISWRVGYQPKTKLGKAHSGLHDGRVDADDTYGSYTDSYLRLINAYRLDAEAALKSCSWGKFQIMGRNHKLCGSPSVEGLVDQMCTSERRQLELLAQFIQRKPPGWKDAKNKSLGREISLWDAVKTKNWQAIAFNFNGPGHINYDTKLRQAYEKHRTTHA